MGIFKHRSRNDEYYTDYIRNNWKDKSDPEIGKVLGINSDTVRSIRRRNKWIKREAGNPRLPGRERASKRKNNVVHNEKGGPKECFDYLTWLKSVVEHVGTDQKRLNEFRKLLFKVREVISWLLF